MNIISARTVLETYIESINTDFQTNDTTEHSYRGALKVLLQNILNEGRKKKEKDKIAVINEPKRKEYGAPDFELRRDDIAISFIETKDLGDKDLLGANDKKHKEQFDRYKKAITTIAFTDYLRFFLFENGELSLSATIGEIKDNEVVLSDDEQQISLFLQIIGKLGDAKPQPVRSAKLLAIVMANKAKVIANILNRAMEKGENAEDVELHNNLQSLQKFLVHDMTVEQFTDFYAQTILYGLFIARIYDKTPQSFSLQEAGDLIPTINPFLKKIFKHLALAELHSGVKWIVEDLVTLFRVTDINRVMHNYGKDPLVHFYEEFLEQYNPKIRDDFGVWYTPEEVVKFIVESVDIILRENLGVEDGLANNTVITFKEKQVHRVQILDPATGTGTFLAMTAEKIRENYKGREPFWPEDVVKNIIPRLNGFEYLMAPYTMAHLKLATSLHLDEIKLKLPERLQIFLTNSLEEDHPEENLDFAKFITDESNAASTIKRDMPVMVVMGNPPYNEKSANNGDWIKDLMDSYKQEPGHVREYVGLKRTRKGSIEEVWKNTLKEKNPKAINNDYCKFIRIGQNFVEKTNEGILAYICGNTFLDTPLFRGMRYELLKKFDDIYIINLHGSTKRQESTEGQNDECVFNIQVGVSINIFVKRKDGNSKELATVRYKDLYGTRKEKLEYLATHKLGDIDFKELSLSEPLFTFRLRERELKEKYDEGFKVNDLIKEGVKQGFKTGADDLIIHYTKESIERFCDVVKTKTFEEFAPYYKDREKLAARYNLIHQRINESKYSPLKFITEVCYRPFDNRWVIYGKVAMDRPRPEIEKNIFNKKNYVLCLGKMGSAIGDREWTLSYISTLPTDINLIPRGGVYLFPLFVYDDLGLLHINYSFEIIKKIEKLTGLHLQQAEDSERESQGFLPLDLLDYIYAVLHSTLYRKTYHECLQDDFPVIPYPSSAEYFFRMAELGGKIRKLHLLEDIEKDDSIGMIRMQGDNIVTKRFFEKINDEVGRVWINDCQYFDNVPECAWNLVVSGYQPLDLWLKNRKDKQLSNDDFKHYQKMVIALRRQVDVMQEIDKIIILDTSYTD